MKVKIVNKDGWGMATEIYDEAGNDLTKTMGILFPIDIHIDGDDVVATLRVLVSELDVAGEAKMLPEAEKADADFAARAVDAVRQEINKSPTALGASISIEPDGVARVMLDSPSKTNHA